MGHYFHNPKLEYPHFYPSPKLTSCLHNPICGKDGSRESLRESSRVDVPKGYLDPLLLRQPGMKYFPAANQVEKWIYEEQENYFKIVKEVFAPLLK